MDPRLLLVAGPGGAGSSTCAARLAQEMAAARPGRVAVVDLDPVCGASALVGPEVRTATAELRTDARGPGSTRSGAPSAVTDWAVRAGLDARVPDELRRLPGVDVVTLLDDCAALAHDQHDVDVVVVDVGSALPQVLTVADRAPWLVDQGALLQRGWFSTVRPLASALVPDWPGESLASLTRAARARVDAWLRVPTLAEVVLVEPTDGAPVPAWRTDGIDPVRPDHRVRRVRVTAELYGIPIRAARDVVETEANTAVRGDGLHASLARGRGGVWEGAGSDWLWRLPLPSVRSGELALARDLDDLAIEALGVRRVVRLPTAMRRLSIGRARLRDGVLTVPFGGASPQAPSSGSTGSAERAEQEQ